MVYTEISSAATGEQAAVFKDYYVAEVTTDSATGGKETAWVNTRAGQFLGYYKTIPELKIAIDTKATWTIGKGIITNELTTLALSTIKGIGIDTFNSILENLIREYHVYGDAFAEIIKSGEQFVNLKPLDPSIVKIIVNEKGLVIRYEVTGVGGKVVKFKPEAILHLARNRIADEVHGVSIIRAVEWIILARNEAMADNKKLLHRNVYPVRVWELDTDVPAKIASFKAKVAESKYKGEDIFVPKGAVQQTLAAIPAQATLSVLPWIQYLNRAFFQTVGVPQIIVGGSQELTQTAAQVSYLAWEQTIEEEQLFIKEQILSQLNLEIDLKFPASLRGSLLSDEAKDGSMEQNTNQPNKLMPPMARGPVT